jgi:GTP cyclohydrolase I
MSALADAYKTILNGLAIEDMIDAETPTRHIRALTQLTHGVTVDPTRHLAITFPSVTTTPTLITVTEIPYVSICAHHLLPFWGIATIAYLPKPDAKIVGLSKLARVLQDFAARPQIQEQLGQQVLDALTMNLETTGAAIAIQGTHACMALRGASTGTGTKMITMAATGNLEHEPWRNQFLLSATTVLQPR